MLRSSAARSGRMGVTMGFNVNVNVNVVNAMYGSLSRRLRPLGGGTRLQFHLCAHATSVSTPHTTGMATRDSVTSPNKNHHIPIFLARIGFRSEHCGFGRDWTWTFHCFSIGYLRAGVLLLLHFADHFVDHFANEHIHDTRSRLCSGLQIGREISL